MKHIPNDKSISCVSEGLGEAKLLKNLITQQILMKYNTGILMKYNPGCDGVTIAKEKNAAQNCDSSRVSDSGNCPVKLPQLPQFPNPSVDLGFHCSGNTTAL